jgi:hypothetical protein
MEQVWAKGLGAKHDRSEFQVEDWPSDLGVSQWSRGEGNGEEQIAVLL